MAAEKVLDQQDYSDCEVKQSSYARAKRCSVASCHKNFINQSYYFGLQGDLRRQWLKGKEVDTKWRQSICRSM
jgi:hypothetical protein